MTYISTLPTPPSRSDDPTGFSAKADALLAALPDFVTEANTLSDEVDAMRDDAEAKRAATATLKDETIVIKDAAEDARDAALSYRDTANTYRGQAETARDNAQAAAAAAASGAGLPALTGNALKVLRVNSGETGVEFGIGVAQGKQVFDESGTWTKPDEATWVYVEAVAAGGSGAANSGTTSTAGGSGGEFADKLMRAADVPATVTVTVGAGGDARVGNQVLAGMDGGDSSFGDIVVARGGRGGSVGDNLWPTPKTCASPGLTESNAKNFPWATAGPGAPEENTTTTSKGGAGGGGGSASNIQRPGGTSVMHGDGGYGSDETTDVPAEDGHAPGGGGGGRSRSTSTSRVSGAGADGQVTVYWW